MVRNRMSRVGRVDEAKSVVLDIDKNTPIGYIDHVKNQEVHAS